MIIDKLLQALDLPGSDPISQFLDGVSENLLGQLWHEAVANFDPFWKNVARTLRRPLSHEDLPAGLTKPDLS